MNKEQRHILQHRAHEMIKLNKPAKKEYPVNAKDIKKLEVIREEFEALAEKACEKRSEYYKVMKEVYGCELEDYEYQLSAKFSYRKNTIFPKVTFKEDKEEMIVFEKKQSDLHQVYQSFTDSLIFEGAGDWKKVLSDFNDTVKAIKES